MADKPNSGTQSTGPTPLDPVMAKRYPSMAAGAKPASPAAPSAGAEPMDPALAKRYPSMGGKGSASAPAPRAALDPEMAELARRYPSLAKSLGVEVAAEKAPVDPDLAKRYPSLEADQADEDSDGAGTGLQAPEGFDVKSPHWAEFSRTADEVGLDQAAATKLLKVYDSEQKARAEAWDKAIEGWGQQSQKDQEIGGGNWDRSLKVANDVAQEFGTPALLTLLEDYGHGNHPEVIRLLVRVGDALAKARRHG
jgi:hypothetical protein